MNPTLRHMLLAAAAVGLLPALLALRHRLQGKTAISWLDACGALMGEPPASGESFDAWTYRLEKTRPPLWGAAALWVSAKLYLLFWAFLPPVSWSLLGLLLAFDFLTACLLSSPRAFAGWLRLQAASLATFAFPFSPSRLPPAKAAAAVFLGLLMAAGYFPGAWGVLHWVLFVPFLWIVLGSDLSTAFRFGWLFGSAAWLAGLSWMVEPLHRFLGVSRPGSVLLFVVLCAYHGLSWGFSAWLVNRLAAGRPAFALLMTAAPAFVFNEGFFLNLFAAGMADSQYFHLPTVQMLELFGKAGVTWLVVSFNAALLIAIRSRAAAWKPLLAAGLLVLANEAYGRVRIAQVSAYAAGRSTVRIAALQPVIPIGWVNRSERHTPENLDVLNALTRQALAQGPLSLVVWPEFSYGRQLRYRLQDGAATGARVGDAPLDAVIRSEIPYRTPLLLGTEGLAETGGGLRRQNLSFLVGASGELAGTAAKRILFPFGEYMPFGETFPILYKLSPKTARLWAEKEPRLLTTPDGVRLGVLICYEDLFPEGPRDLARLGADVLVNQTNPIWFDFERASEQNLRFSALRSIETRKSMVRSVNTGVSDVVDPTGRVLQRVPRGERGVLVAEVPRMDLLTPHARTGRLFYWLALLPPALLLLLSRLQRPR